MKAFKAVLIVALLLFIQAYTSTVFAGSGYMRLSYLQGDAQIMNPEAGEWTLLSINTPIGEGDQIWIPRDGIAELELNSGSYIRLDSDSSLQILAMDQNSSQFYLSQGSAYVYYNAPRGNVIQVDTPDASTRVFDQAIFRIDILDQYTDVSCYKGYVETENQRGMISLNAGQTISLGRDTNGSIAPVGPPDGWDQWNRERNDQLFPKRQAAGGNYLPMELRSYSYELDRSGRWAHVPQYGNVWIPTVSVGIDWAPYRHGRWVRRGHDYIWLASEPWGWVPYHYGRWAFTPAFGWFWVPPLAGSVYWGPGYVGWVMSDDYVGWVPLAPGEIYYGRGYFGRYSVNITHIDIRRVHVTREYRNVHVHNGPTIIKRNSFYRGYPGDGYHAMKMPKEKIFDIKHMRPGIPNFKPPKESYYISERVIPRDKLAPARVREIKFRELKESRRFIKDRDKSVLHPGMRLKPMPIDVVSTPRSPGRNRNLAPHEMSGNQQFPGRFDNDHGKGERGKEMRNEDRQDYSVPPRGRDGRDDQKQRQLFEDRKQSVFPDSGRNQNDEAKKMRDDRQRGKTMPDISRDRNGDADQRHKEEQRRYESPDAGQWKRTEPKPTEVESRGHDRLVTPEPRQSKPFERNISNLPDKSRERREDSNQGQSEKQRQFVIPDTNRGKNTQPQQKHIEEQRQREIPERNMNRNEEPQGMQLREQRQFIAPNNNRDRREERPRMQLEEQRRPTSTDIGRSRYEERRQARPDEQQRRSSGIESTHGFRGNRNQSEEKSGSAQCGPGQKDEFNSEKCPQRQRR